MNNIAVDSLLKHDSVSSGGGGRGGGVDLLDNGRGVVCSITLSGLYCKNKTARKCLSYMISICFIVFSCTLMLLNVLASVMYDNHHVITLNDLIDDSMTHFTNG